MPAAAVIPAPGVHWIIAETKTSVVGTIDLAAPAVLARSRRTVRGHDRAWPDFRAASVRVRDPNQVIKTSTALDGSAWNRETGPALASTGAGDDQREQSEARELQGEG